MKRATIYFRKARFFVHASSQTLDGVWVFALPCVALDKTCNDLAFGNAIREALDASLVGIPHPRTWTGLLDPLLKAAQVKSWGAFSKSATCVEIEQEGEKVIVLPTKDLGVAEGYQTEPHNALTLASSAIVELGSSARRLLLP